MNRILFFTPFGGKTGSEKLLWYTLHHFDRSLFQAALYCEQNGILADELPNDVPFYTSAFEGTRSKKLYVKALNALGRSVYENKVAEIHRQFGADTWYLNTVMMTPMTKFARKRGVKLIFHVHELESLLESTTSQEFQETLEYADLVIANSLAVQEMLRDMGAKNVELCYPFVDLAAIKIHPERRAEIRKKHQIPADAFVWAMSGSPIFKKGVDIFPQIARELQHLNYHFVWLGSIKEPSALNYLAEQRVKIGGLSNVSFLKPSSADYYDYLNMADGFMLTSREEPFGMVLVEAAHLGKPIVAFDAGGPAEFVGNELGIMVSRQNVSEMVAALQRVASGQMKFDPAVAQSRAAEFDAKVQIKNWERIVSQYL